MAESIRLSDLHVEAGREIFTVSLASPDNDEAERLLRSEIDGLELKDFRMNGPEVFNDLMADRTVYRYWATATK